MKNNQIQSVCSQKPKPRLKILVNLNFHIRSSKFMLILKLSNQYLKPERTVTMIIGTNMQNTRERLRLN